MPAATEALRDETSPTPGIDTRKSHSSFTSLFNPFPSPPMTRAKSNLLKSSSKTDLGANGSAPTTQTHLFFKSLLAVTRFTTLATLTTPAAPAEAFITEGVTDAALSLGITTPCTPRTLAVLIIPPRL